MIVDCVVHTIMMGDVDDPDLFVAEPIWNWQQTEGGKWIMQNSVELPSWHRTLDPSTYGYKYQIRAKLKEEDFVFWKLKYG